MAFSQGRDDLSRIRALYAQRVLATVGVDDPALEAAFAEIPRENFLGAPPWTILGGAVLQTMNPAQLYQDALVQLQAARGVNNGSPSLHAAWLHELAPRAGDRIAHIGAGAGYYTAILSRLAGADGRVTAVEFDAELAAMARENLENFENVEVVCGDGALWPREEADRIYVNFGIERPAAAWLDNLAPKGRLIFPLCARDRASGWLGGDGVGFLIEKRGEAFAATALSGVVFVCGEGVSSTAQEDARRLREAFRKDGVYSVKSLKWREAVDPERCWLAGGDWALSYDEPA